MNDDIWSYNFIDQAMKENTFTSQYEGKLIQDETEESLKTIKDMMMDQMSKNMDKVRREREIKIMKDKWYGNKYYACSSFCRWRMV